MEGQPQYISSERLVADGAAGRSEASRWRSFLSVPIRVEFSDKNMPVGLPVGVITLATTAAKQESVIPSRETAEMQKLVDLLRNVGRKLLKA